MSRRQPQPQLPHRHACMQAAPIACTARPSSCKRCANTQETLICALYPGQAPRSRARPGQAAAAARRARAPRARARRKPWPEPYDLNRHLDLAHGQAERAQLRVERARLEHARGVAQRGRLLRVARLALGLLRGPRLAPPPRARHVRLLCLRARQPPRDVQAQDCALREAARPSEAASKVWGSPVSDMPRSLGSVMADGALWYVLVVA